MTAATLIAQVALPTPLAKSFSYQVPSHAQIGSRVQVSFGRQSLLGLIIALEAYDLDRHQLSIDKIKPVQSLLDQQALLNPSSLQLAQWLSDYYLYPLGETLSQFLPTLLRQGQSATKKPSFSYQLSPQGRQLHQQDSSFSGLQKAPQQQKALQALAQQTLSLNESKNYSPSAIKALLEKQLIAKVERQASSPPDTPLLKQAPLALNAEQANALEQASAHLNGFNVTLLQGVTGSGKTEVYLQLIEQVLASGQQCLVLVPEIGLTPQTLSRFQSRFNRHTVALHSGLSPRKKLDNWLDCQTGAAHIIIGTRSACLNQFANLGLIIIDEEHDLSFKQQEGLRYNARDVAIKRAASLQIPVMLGSATPSLESLYNCQRGKYQHLFLLARAGKAKPPLIQILDVRQQRLNEGLSKPLFNSLQQNLAQGQQSLLFINRRGFAPALICSDCGWNAQCPHCDMRLTSHKQAKVLRCHHCDYHTPLPFHCPQCFSKRIEFIGQGTQRLEAFLQQQLDAPIIRIDRDNTSNQKQFEQALAPVLAGKPCVLVGTQMLAKGHHFPNITLVGIIDADAGLYSADFRAPERFGQLLLQVAGRAGREAKQGLVLIQTQLPEHPLLNSLCHQDYQTYAQQLLQQRQQQALPPFAQMALLRSDHNYSDKAQAFLQQIRQSFLQQQPQLAQQVQLWGPSPAVMARRAGRYRWQLNLHAPNRKLRAQACQILLQICRQQPQQQQLRWSLDIDPQETS